MKIGYIVIRLLCGTKMELLVTDVSDELITCGYWTFDPENGAEIDEELGWDKYHSGSYIILEKDNENNLA